VLPLLPEFMRAFHTSLSEVTWVFTAALLASAVATPLLSRLGDMYGSSIGAAVTSSILATDVLPHTDVPTLHAYMISFAILAAGGLLAAIAAASNVLTYPDRRGPRLGEPLSLHSDLTAAAQGAREELEGGRQAAVDGEGLAGDE
jgi:MFS family permease